MSAKTSSAPDELAITPQAIWVSQQGIQRRNGGDMTGGHAEDLLRRGEMLIHLRRGIRQSARLAESLAGDAIVGSEALALWGRLQAIRGELDGFRAGAADLRRAHNDPFWNEPPHLFHVNGPGQADR
jgi:hypothetical protein